MYDLKRIGYPDLLIGKNRINSVLKTISCIHLVYTNRAVQVSTWWMQRGGKGAS